MQRVAVIGAGKMGQVHAKAYSGIPNAQLVAVCDPRVEQAQELASAYSASTFSSIDQLVKGVEVDVIDICTPTPTHLDAIKAAAAAGKNVICEKPLARSISQAMEAARICDEAGVRLFVAHVLRWFPEYRRLRDLIRSGSIGETAEIRLSRSCIAPRGADDWFRNLQTSGGAVLDLIVHEFDWLRSCYGNVRRVYARGLYNSHIPDMDYALVTLRFDSGVIAHVEGSWARAKGFVSSAEVAGTKGLFYYRNPDTVPLAIERRDSDGNCESYVVCDNSSLKTPYEQELEHFIGCIEDGSAPEVTAEDGIEAVRIAEAALRSITTGEPVTLA